MLDVPDAAGRLRAALARRSAVADPRTVSRELSILRGALAWWRMRGWISGDPLHLLRSPSTPPATPSALTSGQVAAIFDLPASLREQTCWHLLYETAAPIERILALNVDDLDLARRRVRADPAIRWRSGSARLLPLLLAGRAAGPVVLTERRAPSTHPVRDRCPVTGRGRLSYRRAAELFTLATRPLTPDGQGWTLRRLRSAGFASG
jgi:integrase/recombinase XerD